MAPVNGRNVARSRETRLSFVIPILFRREFSAATPGESWAVGIKGARWLIVGSCPFGSMAEAHTFLHKLTLSEDDRDRIAHGNAERLFRL